MAEKPNDKRKPHPTAPKSGAPQRSLAPRKEESKSRRAEETKSGSRRHLHWVWPLGLAVAGLGSAAAFLLRGCWHTRMSWPVRHDDEFSYQVCTSCGAKRLFDPDAFQAYGPYGYELPDLIARERAARMERMRRHNLALARSEENAERKKGA